MPFSEPPTHPNVLTIYKNHYLAVFKWGAAIGKIDNTVILPRFGGYHILFILRPSITFGLSWLKLMLASLWSVNLNILILLIEYFVWWFYLKYVTKVFSKKGLVPTFLKWKVSGMRSNPYVFYWGECKNRNRLYDRTFVNDQKWPHKMG